jgi:cytochrome oxidase Cu insertion factor (SCO1/SenC/PrrC family)
MDATAKASILNSMIRRMGAGGADVTTRDWLDFVEAQNDGYQTGPDIGQKVPDFTLIDQHGQNRSLKELTGPNGLLLVFSRSADW